jgi:hypothetical protein
MQVNDRQPAEALEITEIHDRVDLRRTAHKIAWARMNGCIDAANPSVGAGSNRSAPEGRATRE